MISPCKLSVQVIKVWPRGCLGILLVSRKICQDKTEIFRLKKARTTSDAKAVIIKMKIMPILSFLARVYCFPSSMINRLYRIVLNYVLPKSCSLTIYELNKSQDSGGYDILDIPLFLELLYVKQVKNYYLYKTDQGDCLPHLFLMEYNASRMFDKKLKLSPRNSIPHAFTPSEFYNRFLHVLDSHNLGKNEIETMNTRQIYYTIIEQRSQRLIPFVPFSTQTCGNRYIMIYYRTI